MANKLVKNSKHKICTHCNSLHGYLTRSVRRGLRQTCRPVAFSEKKAITMARIMARGEEDVVAIPDQEVVVLDASARRLPIGPGTSSPLGQERVRSM